MINIKIYKKLFFLFLCIFLSANAVTNTVARSCYAEISSQQEIQILVNGHKLFTDPPPVIENGRTLVPVRALLEELGGEVEWDSETRSVTIYDNDQIEIGMTVGNIFALVNGSSVKLDVPPRIIKDRTFVPLRFISETLGAEVDWNGEQRLASIYFEQLPLVVDENAKNFPFNVNTYGVEISSGVERVRQVLGEPARKDDTLYGCQWWIYNDDLHHYLQVGIKEDKVVALYTCGEEWEFGAVRAGSQLQVLEDSFELTSRLYVEEINTAYLLYLPTVIIDEEIMVTFYYDSLDNNKITALRIEDKNTAADRFKSFFAYRSSTGEKGDDVEEQKMRHAEAADEQQIFDLVNVERVKRGLPRLQQHNAAAIAALEHSKDMYLQDYFSHFSPDGKTIADRFDEQNVSFRFAAENIARGHLDGLEVHHSLMDSFQHRKNILDSNLEFLGVGVYRDCYTQNFLTY